MNAITGERLLLTLEARLAKYERDIARARRKTDTQLGAIEARALRTAKNLRSAFVGVGRFAGPLAVAFTATGATALADTATKITNALKIAGLEGENLEAVYERLFASAQANAAPVETLVELYSRLSLVQGELGVSQEELLGFTDSVALALRVAGTDAQAASGALLQLSQAMGSGTVRAEEFNSILEGALPIAQAAATGLEEAGGSVAKLRQLVVDGKVSSEAFFRAFEAGSVTLKEKVAGAEATIGQRFVRLQNVLLDTAGKLNVATGATDKLGEMVDYVADIIPKFGEALISASGPVGEFMEYVDGLENSLFELAKRLGEVTGLNQIGVRIRAKLDEVSADDIQSRIDSAHAPRSTPKTDRLPTSAPVPVNTVSLMDFALPARGEGGRSSGTASQDAYERSIELAQRRLALLRMETAALGEVNPLLDDYAAAVEAASMKAQLLAAAQEAGREITPELSAEIEKLAASYGKAASDAARLAEAQDQTLQAAEEWKDVGKDLLGGFLSDLRQGRSLADALANAFSRLADKLADMMLDSLFGGLGGGNWLMRLLGFAGGGEVKGYARGGRVTGPGTGTSDSIVARLSAGEHVINAESARKHRRLLELINADRLPAFASGGTVGTMPSAMLGGNSGSLSVTINAPVNVEATAGTPEQNADLAKQISRQMEGTMRGVVVDELRRQMRPGNILNSRAWP